jgi:hypothetical protein
MGTHTEWADPQPLCELCQVWEMVATPAVVDAKTRLGPWALMCERHWQSEGTGILGTGYGQRIDRKEPE